MALLTSERGRGSFGGSIPGADQMSWYFLRISGAMLVILALGHIFVTHYLNVPSETTFSFVANRWANVLWRTFDWLLLMMALWHGLMGLRISITDFLRSAGWRTLSYAVVWMIGIVFTAIGTITIFTFDAAASAADDGPLADAHWIADILVGSLFVFAIGLYAGTVVFAVWVGRSLRAGAPPIYTGDVGQYAWVLHRASGLGVLFFLLVHIIDIMLISFGREIYDETVEVYANPILLPMEILLVGAVVYHTLNGIRIILVDFWSMGTRRQQQLFWMALIGAVLLTIPSAIVILATEL